MGRMAGELVWVGRDVPAADAICEQALADEERRYSEAESGLDGTEGSLAANPVRQRRPFYRPNRNGE